MSVVYFNISKKIHGTLASIQLMNAAVLNMQEVDAFYLKKQTLFC